MRTPFWTCLFATLSLAASAAAWASDTGALTLPAAVEAAGRRARTDRLRLDLAQANVRMLEAQGRTRIDFRPGLSLLSFSNPLLFATSLGASLSIGKPNAPSAFVLGSASLEVLEAELAAEKARVRAEADTVRAYFRLAEKQQLSDRAGSLALASGSYGREMDRLLKEARITELDSLQGRRRLLDLRSNAVDAESARREAAIVLSGLIGLSDAPDSLRVALEPGPPRVEPAIRESRSDLTLLRERAAAIRRRGSRAPRGSVQAGFHRVDSSGIRAAHPSNYLLGGNTGRLDFNLGLSLRRTGEREAAEEILEARLGMLDAEIERLEGEVRTEAALLSSALAAAAEKAGIARERWSNSARALELLVAREEAGLAARPAILEAELAVYQTYAAHLEADSSYRSYLRMAGPVTVTKIAVEKGEVD